MKLTKLKLYQLINEELGNLGTRGSTGDEYEPIDIEMPDTSGDIEIDFERDTRRRPRRRKCDLYKLRKGCFGRNVVDLQRILKKSLNYNLGTSGRGKDGVDGHFGRRTRKALKDFQRNNGLTPTGVADQDTWSALSIAMTGADPRAVAPAKSTTKTMSARRWMKPMRDLQRGEHPLGGSRNPEED